jgi:hypothetical protein
MTECYCLQDVSMKRELCVLLLCALFAISSGCTVSPAANPVPGKPVFSNGSVVTDGPWISMNPVGDQEKGGSFVFSGSANLPARQPVEVIIVRSGPAAANISTIDDCINTRQKCVLFFGRVTDNHPLVNRWSIRTDNSMDLFRNESPGKYTAIVQTIEGNISARSEFGLT